ncbi:MAG: hypothetical protein ABI865_11295 [Nitrosospira sp.]
MQLTNAPVSYRYHSLAKKIVAYVEDKNLYLDHLYRVTAAAAKFDPAVLLKSYEAVY